MANGQQLSEQNLATFNSWIASQTDESYRQIANRGALSREEIASQCGFSKSALYQNPKIKAALIAAEDRLRERGILPPLVNKSSKVDEPCEREVGTGKPAQEAIRLRRLELENASLRAENEELKKQLARFSVIREALALSTRIPR